MSATNGNDQPLPSVEKFIQTLEQDPGEHFIEVAQDCSICSESLMTNNLPGDQGRVVSMPPCSHLFHKQCIKSNLYSVVKSRNRCPECRAELCALNVLSPEKEAERQAMETERAETMNDFDTDMYAEIMRITDDEFYLKQLRYRPPGRGDYLRIVSEVRQVWTRNGNEEARCCHNHVMQG
jgi:hypothetical protein